MKKLFLIGLLAATTVCFFSCSHRPSKVEQMRQEKALRDSLNYEQTKQNRHYSDSLLQVLLPQTDPLLLSFVYSKHEKAEDHGHYVHRLLQTGTNTQRCFLQAYVADDRRTSVQSYYYGTHPCRQQAVRLSIGEDYVQKEGARHAFEAEGWHEILTIQDKDAMQLLAFISAHVTERIKVQVVSDKGAQATYYLSDNERQALSDTYRLAVLMRDIDALERALHVADLQIQKYEKKHPNGK